ncbi:MAG: cobaltochelatase subunit CobN [Alphaproteobacteria bacterium]|nr:cobaltochelatase subunit CobN [Alphaproteobacteria bacterium]
MHLLVAEQGRIDGAEAVDLGQSPGDVVVLTAADTEVAALAAARARRGEGPSLRLANLGRLQHNLSVDIYVEKVVAQAKLVVVRLLGGRAYWPYGVDRIVEVCRENKIALALLPGDDRPDPDLVSLSTLPVDDLVRLWRCLIEGGVANAERFLAFAAHSTGRGELPDAAEPLPRSGVYREARGGRPVAVLVFYRALVQSGTLAPVDALIEALDLNGLDAGAVYVASLKDDEAKALVAAARPDIVLNATAFSAGPLDGCDCPVLQVVFSGSSEESWASDARGLRSADLAMNVAMPEVDGRLHARAVSFKTVRHRDPITEADIVDYRPVADRIDFVAALAAAWVRLRRAPAAERRVALVLANYPNRDARIGNGVGLDTPASTVEVLHLLEAAGYRVEGRPVDSTALMAQLLAGPTNADPHRGATARLPLEKYRAWLACQAGETRVALAERWGDPEGDPFVRGDAFVLPIHRFGNVVVAVQPARGYDIDPESTYHDPDLVPPHGYLAFHLWLREAFGVHAVVHLGKHGNLEWLPGKATALSQLCWPEIALGPLPNLYPFIVNDPGEGTQAKRRAGAVIVDHLTPPLTRAGSYGAQADLEHLIDEYYHASTLDPRRLEPLAGDILDRCRKIGLDRDCGIEAGDDRREALRKLDRHLCRLKDLQIRDGLHVLGRSPDGDRLDGLLVALARVPRGVRPEDASLIRVLAEDQSLGVDPLTDEDAGRIVDRLEAEALELVAGRRGCDRSWSRTAAVLREIETRLRPAVLASGEAERRALLTGLDGRFVEPGPSGAPTRGKPEVLPTGRNFFSVDTRAVPTPAAWTLGWQSASLLIERHAQEHGDYPKRIALSAWGTSCMRTGGDDVAQALALMGVRPTWDAGSRKITGFEILPASVLGRPRVDVTLRISGFFRDAFPGLVDLVDSAARAVARLDEEEEVNPLAAAFRRDSRKLAAQGLDMATAELRAGFRVFGAKPGAYGAGLQALIDQRRWKTEADLARAFLAWSSFAYAAGKDGVAEAMLADRLESVQAVVHNQDNREHDLLDSDDYYQFEGGLAVAVAHLSGSHPVIYHNDHSRPERPRISTLAEEIALIVRGRAANPKWIAGVMRHGYKGAVEIGATVDHLFAFAATAGAVRDDQFDLLFDAYLADDQVRAFLAEANPATLRDIISRFEEARARELWRPGGNRRPALLASLAETKEAAA